MMVYKTSAIANLSIHLPRVIRKLMMLIYKMLILSWFGVLSITKYTENLPRAATTLEDNFEIELKNEPPVK